MTPALRVGATDRRLRGVTYQVLAWLTLEGVLDLVAWRPCKAEAVARALGCDPSSAWRALEDLRRAGYVERNPEDRWGYRLCWAVLAPVQAVVAEPDTPAGRVA